MTSLSARTLKADAYTVVLDDSGVLDITIRGVWPRERVDPFFSTLAPLHAAARQLHGRVLAMVRVEAVQSPAVALHVRNHALALKQPGDRNAMIVATMLSRLQIGRLASTENFGLFTTGAAARTWLLTKD